MLFFCCHKCHTRTKIVEKKAEKFTGESDEKRVFPCCVLRVSRNWIDEILNYVFRIPAKGCNRVFYEKMCDTCDSKNNKTPCNARVRVRARGVIIGIFTVLKSPSRVLGSLCSVAPSERVIKKTPSLLWKPAVVFMKTSRRFCENEPSFRDVRCVVLSKKFLWFFGEGNKKTEPSSDSVYCLLWLKKGAIRHMLWKKYRANAVLSILCSVMWHWTFNRLLLNRNPRLRRGERLQSHRGHDDLS